MKYTAVQTQKTDDIDSLTTREMLWIIREAGICEVRNGIPAHILLGTEKTPEYIIVPTFDSRPVCFLTAVCLTRKPPKKS